MLPSRLVIAGSLLLIVLACTGGGSAPEREARAPDPPTAEPAPRGGGERKAKARPGGRGGPASEDCTVGLTAVLTGAPGFPAGEGGYARREDVVVRAGPGSDSKVIATINSDGIVSARGKELCRQPDCVYLTWIYDGHGMPAFDRDGGFVEVGLGTGGNALGDGTCTRRGWVGMDVPMARHSVADVITGHTISFRDWDGLVSDAPGAKGRSVDAGVIEVVETREVAGQLWMRGPLRTSRGCEGEPRQVGEGWVPTHGKDGSLQISLFESC